jgi:hypothetical protein
MAVKAEFSAEFSLRRGKGRPDCKASKRLNSSPEIGQNLSINASGEIAGWANVGSNDDAVIWTGSGGLVNLGIDASCGATALGLNDSGEAVGWFNQILHPAHPIRLSSGPMPQA